MNTSATATPEPESEPPQISTDTWLIIGAAVFLVILFGNNFRPFE